jgi:NTE family protein
MPKNISQYILNTFINYLEFCLVTIRSSNIKKIIILYLLMIFCNSIILIAQSIDSSVILKQIKRPNTGLALSGGGAKGLANIGLLKVLEKCGICPDNISGTSMGSIVGGLYSIGYTADEIESLIKKVDWSVLLSDKITWKEVGIFHKDLYPGYPLKFIFNKGQKPSLPSGMIQGQNIHAMLSKLEWVSIKYKTFDDFPIPFRCVASDIMTGQPIVFKDGNLADAMRTSMSITTIFSPVIMDSLLPTDG